MEFVFEVQCPGGKLELAYDSAANSLDGCGVLPVKQGSGNCQRSLRINLVLGPHCNYKCAYCVQSGMREIKLKPLGLEIFATKLKSYLQKYYGGIDHIVIVFWGGEPLVYYDQIQQLAVLLKDIARQVSFSICTNGALLDENKVRWLENNNFFVGLSYDGPGQYLRNKDDVLAPGSFVLEALKTGMRNNRWGISPVWHQGNPLPSRFVEYLDERLGDDQWVVNDNTQMLLVVDDASRKYAFTAEQALAFAADLLGLYYSGNAQRVWRTYYERGQRFIQSLGKHQDRGICSVSSYDPYLLNLDITGKIWACHSATGLAADELGGNLYRGSLDTERKPVRLAAFHKRQKEQCHNCALRMLCHGGCPITPAKYDAINCYLQWHRHFPALAMAIHSFTGGQLVKISRKELRNAA